MTGNPQWPPTKQQKTAARQETLNQIDQAEKDLRAIIETDHPLTRDGQVVTDPATGRPVPDPAPARAAAKELAAIKRQRDRLLGLAPTRVHRLTVPPGTPRKEIIRRAVRIALRDTEDDNQDDQDDD